MQCNAACAAAGCAGHGGWHTPDAKPVCCTCRTNLTEIGEGRRKVVSINLDRMADSVSGQTVVDPKGYLTDLNSIVLSSDAEIGDIKKARMLLKSVINTNPKHAPGWVAAARLEELAGCACPSIWHHADDCSAMQRKHGCCCCLWG